MQAAKYDGYFDIRVDTSAAIMHLKHEYQVFLQKICLFFLLMLIVPCMGSGKNENSTSNKTTQFSVCSFFCDELRYARSEKNGEGTLTVFSSSLALWGNSTTHPIVGPAAPTGFFLAFFFALILLIFRYFKLLRRRPLAAGYLLHRVMTSERAAKAAHDALLQDVQGLALRLQAISNEQQMPNAGIVNIAPVLRDIDVLFMRERTAVMGRQLSLKFHSELEQMFAELGAVLAESSHLSFSLMVLGDVVEPEASAREEIYQLGREVLCNAYRHARAKKIEMEMIYAGSFLLLHVRDDGVGFTRTSELRALFVMRRRLRALGGSLSVWSRSGIGSELSLVVPIG